MYKVLALLIFLINYSFAQVSDLGGPISFYEKSGLSDDLVPLEIMGSFNIEKQLEEDAINMSNKVGPYRFGYEHNVNLNLQNSGVWKKLANGDRVWRIGLKCQDALSINVIFHDIYLPEGTSVHLYNLDHTMYDGAYTSANNNENNMLGTQLVKGEVVYVEYFEPAKVINQGRLLIGTVVHGYRDINNWYPTKVNESGNCNMDVICPDGDLWRDEIRSVARILNGGGLCSGTLVNNVLQDETPYLLTANHCNPSSMGSAVFRFNYNSTLCGSQTAGNSTSPSNNDVINGSIFRASKSDSDFGLVELNSIPQASFEVYYAGWDNSGAIPQTGTGIHHPRGDVKKFAFDDDPLSSTTWPGGVTGAEWKIEAWERNTTTEGGSSGSGLWDENHRIIGQLHGGSATCSNSINDQYGKFSVSWNGNGATSSSQRLMDWLDPQNSGVTNLDGYDPNFKEGDLALVKILSSIDSLCVGEITPNVIVANNGTDSLTTFMFVYAVDEGEDSYFTWEGMLFPGESDTIVLPAITINELGNHLIKISVSLLGSNSDADLSNNSLELGFYSWAQIYCEESDEVIAAEIFPNPFNDEFTISLIFRKEIFDIRIEIFDVSGRLLVSENYIGSNLLYWNSMKFDSLTFSSGTYYVRIFSDSYQKTLKVIKL